MALLLFCFWDTWLPTREWLRHVWQVCTLPSRYFSRSLSRSRLRKSSCRWEPTDSTWRRPDPTMFNCYTHWCTSSPHRRCQLYRQDLWPKPKMYGILVQWAQYNKFVESGSKNWALVKLTTAKMKLGCDQAIQLAPSVGRTYASVSVTASLINNS